ncbi:hypothetical protein [Streptomyces sp. DT203]|uniref:hypothetical protein n=1 Tax=Streptomyces sp. DT203 TaxID=3393424 RepID=UPI003CE77971
MVEHDLAWRAVGQRDQGAGVAPHFVPAVLEGAVGDGIEADMDEVRVEALAQVGRERAGGVPVGEQFGVDVDGAPLRLTAPPPPTMAAPRREALRVSTDAPPSSPLRGDKQMLVFRPDVASITEFVAEMRRLREASGLTIREIEQLSQDRGEFLARAAPSAAR